MATTDLENERKRLQGERIRAEQIGDLAWIRRIELEEETLESQARTITE